MFTGKGFEKKEDFLAKSSDNSVSVKNECLKLLDSYRLLDTSLDKLSTRLIFFPS